MAEKSEKEWQERFKTMKNELGWTYEQMATFVGAKSDDSIKASINRKLPTFAKLAVCVFEEMKGKSSV
jgi:DNA-binding XRE family transcriptional regulator